MTNKRYLLDTCALITAVWQPENIGKQARIVMDSCEHVMMSAVSLWEIALKCDAGKLGGDSRHYQSILASAGIALLPIEAEDIHALYALKSWTHKDPFDRLIVASARRNELFIVSCDAQIKHYYKNVIW